MNNKYIVTLADEYAVGRKIGVPVTIDGNHTAWIRTGIELTPYVEPDFDAIRKEAFEQGYERGTHDAKRVFEGHADEAYQKGLDEAWNAVRKLLLLERDGGLSTSKIDDMFGGLHCREVVSQFSASAVVNCIRKYEQKEGEERMARDGEIHPDMEQSFDKAVRVAYQNGLNDMHDEAYQKGYQDATVKISSDEQAIAEKAYQSGLSDAWEAAREIAHCALWSDYRTETGKLNVCAQDVLDYFSASEAIDRMKRKKQNEVQQMIQSIIEHGYSIDCISNTLRAMEEDGGGKK